jgi:hypothetical protein
MTVELLNFKNVNDIEKWDNFVNKYGLLYHHSMWAEILCSCYGFQPYYLYIEDEGEIKSVFPLFNVKMPLFKNELVSIPHLESGGIINPRFYQFYFDYILKDIRSPFIKIFQFREPINDIIANTKEVIMILDLPQKEDEIIASIKSMSARKRMKKILQKNYQVLIGNDENMLIQHYRLYLRKMKEFGTPPHGFSFFKKIANTFGKNCKIILVKNSEQVLGARMMILFNEYIYGINVSIPKEFLKHQIGYLLNYKTIEFGLKNNLKYFMLGRCEKDSSVYIYKTELGARPISLYTYKFNLEINRYKGYPLRTIKQKYNFVSKIWSKLPSYFTDKLGPYLRKWVY